MRPTASGHLSLLSTEMDCLPFLLDLFSRLSVYSTYLYFNMTAFFLTLKLGQIPGGRVSPAVKGTR